MAMKRVRGPTLSSRKLCERALRAHERLYRLIDTDEPDLGANVAFTAGRIRLLRCVAAEPWQIGVTAGAETVAYIAAAEQVSDPRAAEAWFIGFADEVLVRLGAAALQDAPGLPLAGRRDLDPADHPGLDSHRGVSTVTPTAPGAGGPIARSSQGPGSRSDPIVEPPGAM